jgi:hypothetical protein
MKRLLAYYYGRCHWESVISYFYVELQVITCCLLDKGFPCTSL